MKFATKNVTAVVLGAAYVCTGVVLVQFGLNGLLYGLGIRKSPSR